MFFCHLEYAGKVKCIYIDPPYNTGTAFQNYDDGIEHSIWLTLIKHRLEFLWKLLTEEGTIWISIDDNEVHYLKILLDEVFGRTNFIASLPTIMNLKGNQDEFGFAGTHEYTLVYAKNKSIAKFNKFDVDEDEVFKSYSEDEIGLFKKGATMKATGEDALREKRPKMFYPILVNKDTFNVSTITLEEHAKLYNSTLKTFDDEYLFTLSQKYSKNNIFLIPSDDHGNYTRWRWGYNNETIKKLDTEVIVTQGRKGLSLYKKQRPELGELPTKKPKSTFYKPEYSSGNGTSQIKKLFGKKAFDYPKPEELISDFLHLASNEGDLILDSFLGSGTTAAVAHKMNRKYIGIELGEHAKTLVVPRLKKVIDGTDKGGISKSVNWQGGGGFKFYTLAPSLLTKDKFGNWIIEPTYDATLLASAMAKQEGFKYYPDESLFWKQGNSTENDYIFTTTQFITTELLDKIHDEMKENETLLVCAKSFQENCKNRHTNITIKKIPQVLLGKCEFGKDDYSLNILEDIEEEDDE